MKFSSYFTVPWLTAIACVFVVAFPAYSLATDISVEQDGTGDFDTISDALGAASSGDVIRVGSGTYYENWLHLTFPITIESTLGPLVTQINGSNALIMWIDGATASHIRGFTFTNGHHDSGGAMHFCAGAQAVVENCQFIGNSSTWDGGAVYSCQSGTSAQFVDCGFENNFADYNGGAAGVNTGSHMAFENCSFVENTCTAGCGAVANHAGATMFIDGCLFLRNAGNDTGALRLWGGMTEVRHCTFHGNDSDMASVRINSETHQFEYNIVTGEETGWGVLFEGSNTYHDCNLYFGNAAGSMSGDTMQANEIEARPRYCDRDLDDYTLCDISPALPENNGCGLMGAFEMGCDDCGVIATEAMTWGNLKGLYR